MAARKPNGKANVVTGIFMLVLILFFAGLFISMVRDKPNEPAPQQPVAVRESPPPAVEAEPVADPNKLTTRQELDAYTACYIHVQAKARYPSKADFRGSNIILRRADDGYIYITGMVDFQNQFGAMIPHRYDCQVSGDRVIESYVRPE